jgi:hypothetical protein
LPNPSSTRGATKTYENVASAVLQRVRGDKTPQKRPLSRAEVVKPYTGNENGSKTKAKSRVQNVGKGVLSSLYGWENKYNLS